MSESRSLEAPLFDERLQPHRSLGPRGFRILMLGCCVLSTLYSLPFYLMGAWPVVGFNGADAQNPSATPAVIALAVAPHW